MTQLFLLKLMADLMKENSPSNLKTVSIILEGMIKDLEEKPKIVYGTETSEQSILDDEAQAAMRELQWTIY